MTKTPRAATQALMYTITAILCLAVTSPVMARSHPKSEKDAGVGFRGADRDAVRGYFALDIKNGNCPPGLAKKRNGCQPPGQAKKQWTKGQPLPAAVVYEPLPSALIVRLGPPPPNHEYVRVAGDILMLAAGTHMVVDAITDLGGALR
ncbi:MAG: RcnB family protein [Proteobacteria bacterium]|nr:RcnB family protein [Pseudomonadota bacterium]